jgi:hypothetical protein
MYRSAFALVIAAALIVLPGSVIAESSNTTIAMELFKLAPCISLNEKVVTTYQVRGLFDFNGIHLQFNVLGKKPNQSALLILDPRDETPIMFAVGNSFMLYDPILSEVLLGHAVSTFTLNVERLTTGSGEADADNQNLVIGLGFRPIGGGKERSSEEGLGTTIIDIHSLLGLLMPPVEVKKERDGERFVLSGHTKRGNTAKAYVVPSRKEGPYARVELYLAGEPNAFLILDEIMLNQPIPAERFAFPEEKLKASGLPTRQLTADTSIKAILSVDRFVQAIMARLVLTGAYSEELRSAVEKMTMQKINWQNMVVEDRRVSPILKATLINDRQASEVQSRKTAQ